MPTYIKIRFLPTFVLRLTAAFSPRQDYGGEGRNHLCNIRERWLSMVRTARFRRQHDEIMAIVQEISSLLTNDLKKDARKVPQLLSTLADKLTVLSWRIMPSPFSPQDDQLRPLAEEFMEMGVLATFKEYVRKWPDAGTIEAGRQSLSKKPRVFDALHERITREDRSFTHGRCPGG